MQSACIEVNQNVQLSTDWKYVEFKINRTFYEEYVKDPF